MGVWPLVSEDPVMLRSALALALVIDLVGCREKTSSTRADASLEMRPDATIAERPAWIGTVAVRVVGPRAGLTRVKDDGLVLRTGDYVHTIDRAGVVARLGRPADYVRFLQKDDFELGGPNPRARIAMGEAISGNIQAPFVRLPAWVNEKNAPPPFVVWTGNAWAPATDVPAPEEDDRTVSRAKVVRSTTGLPPDHVWSAHHTTKSRIVWIGFRPKLGVDPAEANRQRQDITAIAPAEGAPGHLVDLPDESVSIARDAAAPTSAGRFCHFLESADDSAYLACTYVLNDTERTFFYALQNERWVPFLLAAIGRTTQVIDAEGGLWYIDQIPGVGTKLMRVTKGNEPEEVTLPAPPAELTTPSYRTRGDRRYPSWENASIVDKPAPVAMRSPYSITVRQSGDVWVVGQDSSVDPRLGITIVRFTRPGVAVQAPVLLRSDADQRNEILNARALRKWDPKCNTAFVPFPDPQPALTESAFFAKHKAAVEDSIAKLDESGQRPPIPVAIVTGTFAERRVTGAVFLRSEPIAAPEAFAAAVSRLVALVSKHGGAGDEATCSVPTLDAIIAKLH